MQDTTQAPTDNTQAKVDPTKAGLAALQASFKAIRDAHLVTEEENAAKVKAAMKDAKRLLKELRGGSETNFFDIDSEDRAVPDNGGNCRCCGGKGEHDTGKECYGCDGSGLDRDYTGPNPCDGVSPEENAFKVMNANISPDQQRQIDLATEQFKQSVQRVDNQILQQYVQAIQNGSYAEAEAILAKAQESVQQRTLAFALLTIGAILLPLYAKQRLQNLLTRFGLHTVFAHTDSADSAMKEQAEKGATSHVQTIARDLKKSLDDAIDSELKNPVIEAGVKDKYEDLAPKDQKDYLTAVKGDQHIYEYARHLILEGESRQTIIKKLQENFSEVGKRRATVIAGNEANRVFTVSQYTADEQFLAQNKLTDKAYKRLISNTGTPEAVCKAIIEKTTANPIPFKQDFIPFGKVFTGTGDDGKTFTFKPTYEHLKSGHIHVNCHCRYELLIKQDDGTFLNTATWRVMNDFTEDRHPRWPKGTPKGGKFMKMGDINVDKYVDLGIEIKGALEKAHADHDWALSGFGDSDATRKEVQDIEAIMYNHYGKALKENGFTDDDHKKLRQAQIDYSRGAGMRGEDGKYLQEPELMKQTGAAMVHQALTQAILKKDAEKFKLWRGEKNDNAAKPKGIVSYTDSKAISISFGGVNYSQTVDVKDIKYHYLLDFTSVHPSEQEVIVGQ